MSKPADVEACVDAVLARVGPHIRLATPLGIGKPNHFLNALYRRVRADASLQLEIMTALSLQLPAPQSELERRFLLPFVERVFGNYPDLDYELDRVAGKLPRNVRVLEFYLQAGKLLRTAGAQRDYISTNYTFVARDLIDRGVNLIAQEVCRAQLDGASGLSLSCNADLTLDLVRGLRERNLPVVLVAQINQELPKMGGEALVPEALWDFVIDDPSQYHTLFCTPKQPVSDAEYMIGLYASTLIQDGGSLQIGIGALGDALVYALKLRHEQNDVYRQLLVELGIHARFGRIIERIGATGVFRQGLFAPTEMLVDGFMHLMQAGILKRKVFDDVPIQRALDAGACAPDEIRSLLHALLAAQAIDPMIDAVSFAYLQRWGILRAELSYDAGSIVLADGSRLAADLGQRSSRQAIETHCLGDALRHGRVAHASFFLGSAGFYRWLRELPDEHRELIDMRSVSRVNQLYGHEQLDRLQRRRARFVNTGMMVTLLGAVVSDALDDGRVVSGVGGQYNFVAMAHALEDARSIMQVRAVRQGPGGPSSGVVWNYGHATIPRHLRDVVVTEYGIAELRGATDQEVAERLLAIADGRFQQELETRAKRAGKLEPEFRLPELHRRNFAQGYAELLSRYKRLGLFPSFPFDTEMTAQEVVLGKALTALKRRLGRTRAAVGAASSALLAGKPGNDLRPYLERMGLWQPSSASEFVYQRLLSVELRRVLA